MDADYAQDFAVFVAEQDPEREIDHHLGWEYCAVGDYVKEALEKDRFTGNMDPVLINLLNNWGELYDALNHGYVGTWVHDEYQMVSEIATYGALHSFIEEIPS